MDFPPKFKDFFPILTDFFINSRISPKLKVFHLNSRIFFVNSRIREIHLLAIFKNRWKNKPELLLPILLGIPETTMISSPIVWTLYTLNLAILVSNEAQNKFMKSISSLGVQWAVKSPNPTTSPKKMVTLSNFSASTWTRSHF